MEFLKRILPWYDAELEHQADIRLLKGIEESKNVLLDARSMIRSYRSAGKAMSRRDAAPMHIGA